MVADYLIVYPERCCLLKLFLSVILPHGIRPQFIDCPESLRLQLNENWKLRVSLILMKIVKKIAGSLATLGIVIEFFLNLFSHNGGLLRSLINLLKGSIAIPKRGTEAFLSIVGHVEGRLDLYNSGPQVDRNEYFRTNGSKTRDPGDRFFADISVMASTIIYENEFVIRKRVDENWRMHFVEYFDFWNDYLQKKSTQAFVFCDKKVDAELIVIAFRGTQIFEAEDFITDLDFSWYEYPQMGKVHFGFLEALGLANRSNDKTSSYHLEKQDHDKPLAYHVLVRKLKLLVQVHKNVKFIVTGHSLGGALAVLFSAMLFVHEEEKLVEKMMAIYTFGQPRVGDTVFADFMNKKVNEPVPRYFRIVYSNDLVPRIPFEDDIFMYKHFGVCLYYNSLYSQENLVESPNRNFSVLYFIPTRIIAIWELLQSLLLHYTKGKEFEETKVSIICRIFGILVPGISAHSPVNYINAVRLGPSRLNPTLNMVGDYKRH